MTKNIFILTCTIVLFATANVNAQDSVKTTVSNVFNEEDTKRSFVPQIHGTIRTKYEYETSINASRFQVRNARFNVSGKILPFVEYKAEIDLSDEGSTKMLDAYVRLSISKNFRLTAGQMKVPFSTDNLRSPSAQYFANRAFIAKQIASLRDVGINFDYSSTGKIPFSIIGGIFNGSGLYDQKEWQKSLNFSVRATIVPAKFLNISLNMQSIKPEKLRMYLYDVGAYTDFSNFHIEAEYLYKKYTHKAFKNSQSFTGFVNYDLILKKNILHKISFLARFDMMTDNNRGNLNDAGLYSIDDAERKRLTGGITFSFKTLFTADVRLNYEKYFYKDKLLAKESELDKIVIELVARF